ncbi:MAG: hypothetical protein JNL34_15980 [Anaerolineae bacterium]|nr:hypothetical protein [Anaerolineae bacterium]
MFRFTRLLFCLLFGLMGITAVAAQSGDSGECAVSPLPSTALLTGQPEVTPEATPCLTDAGALDVNAYRSRIEAALMAGSYSNALGHFTQMQKVVIPVIPDAFGQMLAAYETQVSANPDDLIALIGQSFAQWWVSDYDAASATTGHLLELLPDNVYATLFRGSSRLYAGDFEGGEADIARALELAPNSADVHFIAADAYLYALGDIERAFEQAVAAYDLGLNTPRVNAILATAYMDQDNEAIATQFFADHIAGATSEYVDTEPLAAGTTITLAFVPGRTYRIPMEAEAGETLTLLAASEADGVDTLAVLLGPDGTPVTSNDDYTDLNAGIVQQVDAAGTYTLVIGTFEGAGTGEVVLSRE